MKKGLIAAGIVVLIAGVGVGLISSKQTYIPDQNVELARIAAKSTAKKAASSTPSTTTQEASNAACIADLQGEITRNKTSYEKGSILISFQSGTQEGVISSVLKDHSLVFTSRNGTSSSPQIWGTAKVASGKELEAVCALRSDIRIKYAGVNPILELHD